MHNPPPTPLHPAFNEKSKNHCGQLQCISSTLYSLTSINCLVTVRGVADCRNLTDGRTDIKCLRNGRKNLITLKDQTKKMYQSSREIRCEICINHFVEIIFTLSCAVVDINLLQINCSQIFC